MGKERIQTGTKIQFGDDVGKVIEFLEEPNTGLCLLEIEGRGHVFDLPVALLDKFRALENEIERLEAVDADRERHFVLLKEKAVAIEQQFNVMASERDRFNASVNRLAEIVGLSGKQCFAPEAVERQAKFELATLRGRMEDLEGKRFPIQGGPSIPWRMIGPHDRQCRRNHAGQSLEDIARRRGLSPSEALAVLDDGPWMRSKWGGFSCEGKGDHPKEKAAHDELERRRAEFEDETNALRKERDGLKDYVVTLEGRAGDCAEEVLSLEARLKALEKEVETVNVNWDADQQELEDALANSVHLCLDEGEASLEMLQIVHAILTCDEKTLPGGLCQCTKYISAQFEGLRAEVKRLLAELQQAREDNSALKEYRTSVCPEERGPDDAGFTQEEAHFWKQAAERDGTEIQRLKTAAVDCDFHILQCPVLKGEDLELLDPVDSIIEVAPGTDFGEGIVDEEGSVKKMGPDGKVKKILFPECARLPVCPNRDECHYYEPELPGAGCGRLAEEGS